MLLDQFPDWVSNTHLIGTDPALNNLDHPIALA